MAYASSRAFIKILLGDNILFQNMKRNNATTTI